MGLNQIIKVGSNIKKLRKGAGLTQKDMAELLNIPCSTYSNYENNNREPKKEVLIKIAEVFDVELATLLSINNNVVNKHSNFVIPYDIKNIQKTETIEKLIKLCGYEVTFNRWDDSDGIIDAYLKEQIRCNLIPLVYINSNNIDLSLTDSQFKELTNKILQLVQFEVNELLCSNCISG